MEALDEVMDSPKDHTHIIKGKRTKRQRPQSPIPLSIAAHTSSGDGGGGYGSKGDNFNATATANNTTSSPATSVEFVESVTEEEADMANCLILLAQGHSRHQSWKPNNHDDHEDVGLKFTSKRFLEAPTTGNGKEGKYFYQCKTCDRSFPSFQALGGHRASHKKAKPAVAEEKRPMMMMLLSDDEEEQYKNRVSSSSYYFSLQLSNNSKSSSKVHECSICGAEFMSGQALGGHMRRHRAPILSSSPSGFDSQDQEAKRPRKVLSLDLDLNLPAPEDDHHRESKFAFASKQQKQQSSLVLSTAPTLVDCHY